MFTYSFDCKVRSIRRKVFKVYYYTILSLTLVTEENKARESTKTSYFKLLS